MVDAALVAPGADPSLADHFGRQVLHWIVGYSTAWYATLSHSDLIDNFKKVDSGAKILLQGLGVKTSPNDDEEEEEEEDDDDIDDGTEEEQETEEEAAILLGGPQQPRINGPPPQLRRRQRRRQQRATSARRRNRVEAAQGHINRYHPLVEYGERNYENLMLVDLMENCERGIPVEMFNVLAPFHQNSAVAGSGGGGGGGGGGSGAAGAGGTGGTGAAAAATATGGGRGGGVVENMQVTQPCSAPSSPTIASPGALSVGSFCLTGGSGGGVGGGGAALVSASVINSNTAADTADPNWQANKSTVRERNAAMFNNDLMADIRFIVGSDEQVQTIPAHKYVLATGSSVFYAMFYGGLAEHKQDIKVPDVEPGAFLTMLKYLYCDEIQLEADNVLATLYVAKKYIVPHLARACVNYLETSLTAKNACLLLSQSRLFEEPELMQRCWEVIDAQAEMAIKSEGFVDIDLKTFETILARETLNCKEIHLFEAALNWAHAACTKMDIEPTSSNKRQLLGQALYLIRIPTMTLEEFANRVAQLGILTNQETIDIFLNFTARHKPKLIFPVKARAGLKTQVCHRFASCAYRSNQWRYRGRCDSIQFSVDKRIFIVGFGLYGSSTGAADYDVKIELKRLGRVLAENSTKFFSDGSSNTFQVFFETPIQIEPECFYTASVVLDGTELSFFGQEGMSEVSVGTVTFQFQCSSESTNGTGVQGGQIPELIFYGPMGVSSGGQLQCTGISASTSNNTINNNHTHSTGNGSQNGHGKHQTGGGNSSASNQTSSSSTTTTTTSAALAPTSSSSSQSANLLLVRANSPPSNAAFGNTHNADGAPALMENVNGANRISSPSPSGWLQPAIGSPPPTAAAAAHLLSNNGDGSD
ncbi:BTB/POZ domain-containing protein 2-like isoform X1 [Anopheles albimanus]|uniref:BTB/POZ domain-containing protein 2-like isoform X1 n=1 Tax=Anopheles albimanus TaxID=7167 RepID=UPI0016410C1C|nr:BTB/POZ domain-containing protein 2-like isoform X1 [Anopheles albimanus]XP_035795512.1 BTB/POZ domain-containing protein 2-like isoform X1 [Anopheles albimanus]XP_035795513.1 BTB/POZ domain-containing protein 2-like isoform X1 [Anopheles albimanus]XP_035795514.1 BTB/POZ domain-containing protein 2-like isoform X1 [Anopheles albimanus]